MATPDRSSARTVALWGALWGCLLASTVATAAFGEEPLDGPLNGAALYAERCADCHGPVGQGTDYHSVPLAGDLPVSELTRVVTETMPEGDPEACVGPEAAAIAAYAHEAFYSPLAQARVKPPRRELSRLTVRQYEQSLADLFAEFRPGRRAGALHGLSARFVVRVKSETRGEPHKQVLPRVDLRLSQLEGLPERFLHRHAPPSGPEGEDKKPGDRHDVYLWVTGGVYAPSSGDYEFRVRSPNAVELSVNDTPVIDAKVRSSSEEQLRGSIRLVGGRTYPLRLHATRTREEDLTLELSWRRPDGVEQPIPQRNLSSERFAPVHATTANFPPDDRSVGYVRGASVSAAWDEATTNAALEAVQSALDDLPRLVKKNGQPREADQPIGRDEAIDFCERFATAAFRRPLTDEERQASVGRYFAAPAGGSPEEAGAPTTAGPDVLQAVERSLLTILKSPRFLYPEATWLAATPELRPHYAAATRLALGLWDSLPDPQLRRAAERGALAKPRPTRRQAERMLDDPRTRSKLAEFFESWLRLDHVSQLSRDPESFPDFTAGVAADMRASLELLLEDVVWTGDGDLRNLFLSEEIYVNHRLARFLGLDPADGDPLAFAKAPVDTKERAGVVSHPYIVTAFSYYRETSPIHRGVFLARNLLGRSLRPPPEAVAPLAPELAPDMTTRERVAQQTSPGACQACHVLINDLGFTLENFDAVGRFRHEEIGRPIDASGGYIATDGDAVRLAGARDLAYFLANSEDVHRSFVTQLMEHVTKQPALAYGVETRERILKDFRDGGFNIRELLVDIAVMAALSEG